MDSLFDAILAGSQAGLVVSDMLGRVSALKWAIVSDNQDPMQLGRIQVLEPAKGAKSASDWLICITPYSGLTLPVPKPNDTVLVGYIDDDAHKGVYFGCLTNQINPPQTQDITALVLTVGKLTIELTPEGTLTIQGVTNLSIDGQNVSLTNVSSFTINGKSVATVGARDSRNDTLVTKGW